MFEVGQEVKLNGRLYKYKGTAIKRVMAPHHTFKHLPIRTLKEEFEFTAIHFHHTLFIPKEDITKELTRDTKLAKEML